MSGLVLWPVLLFLVERRFLDCTVGSRGWCLVEDKHLHLGLPPLLVLLHLLLPESLESMELMELSNSEGGSLCFLFLATVKLVALHCCSCRVWLKGVLKALEHLLQRRWAALCTALMCCFCFLSLEKDLPQIPQDPSLLWLQCWWSESCLLFLQIFGQELQRMGGG